MPGVGTTHQVKIGSDYFMVRPGSYRKRPAPLFGPRFTTGDPDYNNLSFWQHWVQNCWVGGIGAEAWQDDAMIDEAVGIDGSQHDVMVLSRDLGPQTSRTTGNYDLDSGDSPRQRWFTVFNEKLYLLSLGDLDLTPPSRLYVYTEGTNTWTLVKTFAETVRSMEPFGGYLVFGDGGTTMNRMNTSETFSTFNKPASVTDVPYTMKTYRGKMYVGFGRAIWRLVNNNGTFTWDGSTAFYTAEDINYLFLSEIHLGFLYMASQDGHILRTDGNNTFDLWAFEPYVKLWAMRSFDGRLFLGAAEDLAGTTSSQAVIYQFSGAAVTELKRWGKVGTDVIPGRMRVIGSSLFFGASSLLGFDTADGFGIVRYDPIEDGYHFFSTVQDPSTFPAGTEGANIRVDDVAFHNGYIYCTVSGYGVFRTPYSFKDVSRFQATYDTTANGGSPGGQNGGWYTSSDFDAGTPGLLKLWNSITIHVDLPSSATTVYVEISNDGGTTWYPAGGNSTTATVTKTGSATRYARVIRLQDSAATGNGWYATRMKLRLTLRTTDSTKSPQLRGVSLRYLPVPEPNWVWDMVLVLSDKQELLDLTMDLPNNVTKKNNLENAFRDQSLVNFVDIDGTSWAAGGDAGVLIQSMEQIVMHIGPSSAGAIEGDIRIQLIEAVEQYEV